jgi:hypothetical protein
MLRKYQGLSCGNFLLPDSAWRPERRSALT